MGGAEAQPPPPTGVDQKEPIHEAPPTFTTTQEVKQKRLEVVVLQDATRLLLGLEYRPDDFYIFIYLFMSLQ